MAPHTTKKEKMGEKLKAPASIKGLSRKIDIKRNTYIKSPSTSKAGKKCRIQRQESKKLLPPATCKDVKLKYVYQTPWPLDKMLKPTTLLLFIATASTHTTSCLWLPLPFKTSCPLHEINHSSNHFHPDLFWLSCVLS